MHQVKTAEEARPHEAPVMVKPCLVRADNAEPGHPGGSTVAAKRGHAGEQRHWPLV
jgi:hypothetical protein